MRHHWNPSQITILKRGFILTLALFLFMAVFKPVKVNAAEQSEIRVSYINFSSEVDINTDTGNYEHNKNDWVIIDFNLNGYYTGTINYYCTLSTSALIPEVTCVGAYYEVSSSRTSSGSTYQQTDTYTFTIENCQHFQLIYHASTSGLGVYFNGVHSLTDADVTAADGSSSGNVSVDYTSILDGIALDLTNIYQYMDQIAQDSTNIVSTLSSILTGINDLAELEQTLYDDRLEFDVLNTIPYYSRFCAMFFKRIGFTVNYDNVIANYMGWAMSKPTSLTQGTTISLQSSKEYLLVFGINTNPNQTIVFQRYNTSTTFSATTTSAGSIYDMTIKYIKFTPPSNGWYYIYSWSNWSNTSCVYPIYLGTYESMLEEVAVMINEPSNNNLLKQLVSLFTQNNEQNDEMIEKLDTITSNQETINQSINDFNNDFNDAMADIPISETTSQLQQMQSTFTYTNDLISQLWNALGRIQLVIIVALIIALIQIFRGKKT